MAADLNEVERDSYDIYDYFKLNKTLCSLWFTQRYFNAVRVKSVTLIKVVTYILQTNEVSST